MLDTGSATSPENRAAQETRYVVAKKPAADEKQPGTDTVGPSSAEASRAKRTALFLNGPIAPTLARLAGPNVIAMFVMAASSIAEGYFAGQLGIAALAGVALVFPLVMLTQMLAAGAMGGAISAAVARALGAGDAGRAAALVFAAWTIAIGAAAIFAILMQAFGPQIFSLLGGGAAAVEAATLYAGIYFPGCLAVWLCHSSLSVIRGTGNMLMPSLVLFGVSLVSIPLSGALAFGWGFLPELGMAGIPSGQILAFACGAAIAISYIAIGKAGLALRGALHRIQTDHFKDILKVGLIASLNALQTVFTVVIMVGLVGRHGADALAGYGLGTRLEFLMVPVVFGIGSAMTAMVGANIGAGNRTRALRIAWTGSFMAAFLVGGTGAVLAIAPDLWLGMFLDPGDQGALATGRAYFRTVGPFYGFFAIALALYFASQGASRMVWPVVAGLCRMAVAFGGALLLLNYTDMGLTGIFAAIGAAMLVSGVITAGAVKITAWR